MTSFRRSSAGVHTCLVSISYFLEMGCVESADLPFIKPYVYVQRVAEGWRFLMSISR